MTKSKKKNHPHMPRSNHIAINDYALPIIFIVIAVVTASIYYLKHDDDGRAEELAKELYDNLNKNLELAVKPFDSEDGQFPLSPVISDGPVWGTLNSGHYFGLKLSDPKSPEIGLMWFKNDLNDDGDLDVRHLCNQNDRLDFYAWTRHDFHSFGQQTIHDQGYVLDTSFLSNPNDNLEWRARVDVSLDRPTLKPVSVINYISVDNHDDKLRVSSSNNEVFVIEGDSKLLGEFELTIEILSRKENIIRSTHLAGWIDKNRMTQSSYIKSNLSVKSDNGTYIFPLPNLNTKRYAGRTSKTNFIAHQFILSGPASILLTLTQKRSKTSEIADISIKNEQYNQAMEETVRKFDERFSKTFPLDKDFSASLIGVKPESSERLAKVALSNMIGSVGYFYGTAFINAQSNRDKIALYGPIQLLTAVPSRSFFPRGFLWDEGFHNLLISRWDPLLSNAIIESWFNIMNINGWMPREVILGIESMRRVPREFLVQGISSANPPVMLMTIEYMLDLRVLDETRLRRIYPRLKAWFEWFTKTQSGPQKNTFRWRNRDEMSVSMLNPKTLTSGLDDYPRASHPSNSEYHIDLRCWMAMAARSLAKLAKISNDVKFYKVISVQAETLSDNRLLDLLHWSPDHRMYCDYGHNTEDAELIWVTKERQVQNPYGDMEQETVKVLERHSTGHPIFGCVPEFGYVSLFPMLLKILDPKSDKLGIILERLRDREELWTDFGIRSLSKSSKYYRKYNTEHDKPYWRGPIWLNLNYMILSSLKHYSKLEGPYQKECAETFDDLKRNLVLNVVKEFERTNYLWENYDDQTGQGQGSHPFTGWSSLILLIMSEHLA